MTVEHVAGSSDAGKRGCFFYGCLVLVILLVLGGGLVGAASYWGYKRVAAYLEEKPRPLTTEPLGEAAYAALEKRVNNFKAAWEKGEAAQLTLTSPELNAVMTRVPATAIVSGAVSKDIVFSIPGNRIRVEASVPLKDLELPSSKYLNAAALFELGTRGGRPFLRIEEAEVKGMKPSPQTMEALGQSSLLDRSPESRAKVDAVTGRLQDLAVRNGALLISIRAMPPTPAATPTPAEAAS